MIPLVLFATALLVRLGVGVAFPGPAYPDSYYYVHVAQHFAAGNGLTAGFVWNLDDLAGHAAAAGALPIPANALWMPLAELVQAPFIWLLGPTALASGLPFWIIGACAAPLTYWIGRDARLSRGASAVAGLLVAVPSGLTPFMAQPDNFALFMFLGALSLWLCARGARGDRRSFVLGGLTVALATLARSDGILLGLPFAIVAARDLWRRRGSGLGVPASVGCALLFAVVVAPWLLRQMDTFGSVLPSATSGRMLWLVDYQQLFSVANPPTPESWLAQGPAEVILSRLRGLLGALGLFALLPLAVVLAPFAVIGTWLHRSDGAFRPFFIYGFALFAVMALVFPVLVPHGTFIHSAVALVPHTFLLVTSGVQAAVIRIARRRASWQAPTASRVFMSAAVGIALMAAVIETGSVTREWSDARAVQQAVVSPLREAPASDRFMAADPGAINYLTGHQGVVTPNDPLPVIEQVMRTYGVRWLILERASIVPALSPVLSGSVHPDWLSRPVAVVDGAPAAVATTGPVPSTVPEGALYAVCLSPDDVRCQ